MNTAMAPPQHLDASKCVQYHQDGVEKGWDSRRVHISSPRAKTMVYHCFGPGILFIYLLHIQQDLRHICILSPRAKTTVYCHFGPGILFIYLLHIQWDSRHICVSSPRAKRTVYHCFGPGILLFYYFTYIGFLLLIYIYTFRMLNIISSKCKVCLFGMVVKATYYIEMWGHWFKPYWGIYF